MFVFLVRAREQTFHTSPTHAMQFTRGFIQYLPILSGLCSVATYQPKWLARKIDTGLLVAQDRARVLFIRACRHQKARHAFWDGNRDTSSRTRNRNCNWTDAAAESRELAGKGFGSKCNQL